MNSIPLPAVLCVFKAEEWENFGLATVDSSLIYSMIDVLLGGRRGQTSLRIEGRPYTTIETNLVKRLVEVVMTDAEQAFRPLYLIRSEAYAEKSNLTLAEDDLNALRAARISGYINESFASKDEIKTALLTERFKELAFEGHRHFDLRRYNLPITRLPEDAVNALGATLLSTQDARYVFPIPNSELKANKNMIQNPGY